MQNDNAIFDRLRVVAGAVLIICGVLAIVVLGAMRGYNRPILWVAGTMLIVSGIFIAKSVELAGWLSNVLGSK